MPPLDIPGIGLAIALFVSRRTRMDVPARDAVRLLVRGQVQGVGFRPFVYRLALECQISGRVFNHPGGVCIEAEGRSEDVLIFRRRLLTDAPKAAHIDALLMDVLPLMGRSSFLIDSSSPSAPPQVRVPRDLSLCVDCRRDIETQGNRRHDYPFTTCIACGPRYSILTVLPYDRTATSMKGFSLCHACEAEYRSPENRRFHAQPIACFECGPRVTLLDGSGTNLATNTAALDEAATALKRGEIVAVKGLGGFQLLVRADDDTAIARLRARKRRPIKPFAVMVPDLAAARRLALISEVEERLLTTVENPIVLVEARPDAEGISTLVAPGVSALGLFLPTTPLHQLLLSRLQLPVVATSGNRSEEPIVIDEVEVLQQLKGIADVFLVHDRPIVRRVDDSVVRVIDGRPTTFRLARGYAPLPLPALEELAIKSKARPTLAVGGHQKAAVALWTGTQAFLAPHIGDLDHPETRRAFEVVIADLSRLYLTEAEMVACDKHPDYYSTRWARASGKQVVAVQHHHAHAVACMVEHGLLDREVLAIIWDGTGYGDDGTIWGGEILRATIHGFERVASLRRFPLPGGEAAVRHPARIAFGMLVALSGEGWTRRKDVLRLLGLSTQEAGLLSAMVRKGINSPWTSSVGRLFDGVAALVLGVREVTYEGEGAVRLEAIADQGESGAYPCPDGNWEPLLEAVLADVARHVEPSCIAARFQNALASWAVEVAERFALPDVVLGGGCFQNKGLTEAVANALRVRGRRVHGPGVIPPGDGGLAVGQLAIAMATRVPKE